MDYRIVLTANTKEQLNKLIDLKLKENYLLENDMYEEENNWNQVMTQPRNMEGEVTLRGGLKFLIMIICMAGIFYY